MADPAAVDQFVQITGADQPTAAFFLSAANGDCDAAVSAFFESDGLPPMAPPTAPSEPAIPSSATPASAPVPAAAPASSSRPTPSAHNNRPSSNATRPRPRRPPGGIATLGSLERERDDDEKGYYAGGERSGQMIQDPRRRPTGPPVDPVTNNTNNPSRPRRPLPVAANPNADADDEEEEGGPVGLANSILQRARERGPRTDEERDHFEGAQRFTGAGYRLGDAAMPAPQRPTVMVRRNVARVLTFYANGFRVDEGPLRRFDDPNNQTFLADVDRGIVPKEMESPDVGDVSISLIDKKNVDYVEQRQKLPSFSGGGQRLHPAPNPAASSSSAAASSSASAGPADAAAALTVDDSRPVTRVQVRLCDGTRLVARLNEDSTVGQLRAFVRASRPAYPDFTLATAFPKLVLRDDAVSIKDAGLSGAVVIQSLQ